MSLISQAQSRPTLGIISAATALIFFYVIYVSSSFGSRRRLNNASGDFSSDAPPNTESLPFPAYVIAVNASSPRYLRTAELLKALGFVDIVQVAPRVHKLGDLKGDDENTKKTRVTHRACSNKGAHRRAWDRFVADSKKNAYPSSSNDPWAFFFEDDIALNPALALSLDTTRRAILDAVEYQSGLSEDAVRSKAKEGSTVLEVAPDPPDAENRRLRAKRDSFNRRPWNASSRLLPRSRYTPLPTDIPFINLGLCCIVCHMYDRGLRFVPGTAIELVHTCGRCFHAYGMSLSLARELWALLGTGHDAGCELSAAGKDFEPGTPSEFAFSDYLINENLCTNVGGFLLVGRNLEGKEGGHMGIVLQDRGRFPSIVENPEGQVG